MVYIYTYIYICYICMRIYRKCINSNVVKIGKPEHTAKLKVIERY